MHHPSSSTKKPHFKLRITCINYSKPLTTIYFRIQYLKIILTLIVKSPDGSSWSTFFCSVGASVKLAGLRTSLLWFSGILDFGVKSKGFVEAVPLVLFSWLKLAIISVDVCNVIAGNEVLTCSSGICGSSTQNYLYIYHLSPHVPMDKHLNQSQRNH